MTKNALTPVKKARREKILEAAERLFTANGVRATTMVAVAEAAEVSKVTVYSYFDDKEAIFLAVARRLARRVEDAFRNCMNRPGPIEQRVAAALCAKHETIHEILSHPAFAEEMRADPGPAVERIAAVLAETLDAELAVALAKAGYSRHEAERLTRVLFTACRGIAADNASLSMTVSDINFLATAVLSGREVSRRRA